MYRDQVIAILRAHEPELRAAGVEHLRLFGSVARGEEVRTSDVDLIANLGSGKRWTLFTFAGLQIQLSHWVGRTVDLISLDALRPSAQQNADRESIHVF